MALRVSRHEVAVGELDPAHDGLTIVHISDVHVGLLTPERRVRRAVQLANAERPDLVLLTGDYVCYARRFISIMGQELGGLAPRHGVVATLGNHDHWTSADAITAELGACGYDVLANDSTTMRVRGAPLTVVGIDDAVTRHHDPARAFAGAHPCGTRIALTHCPELADVAADHGARLVLAGHTHGGQVHLRGVSERMFRRLTRRRYLSGWYDVGGAALYVNRGVGSSAIPVRAGAGGRSEVAVITLRRAS